jgi:adenylate cyclase
MPVAETLLFALTFVLIVTLVAFRSQVRDLVNLQTTRVFANEDKLMEVTNAMTAEIQLIPLLKKVMESVTDILEADRATLFLFDEKKQELWSQVAAGLETKEIRFPSDAGIAGAVFTSGETINIKDAYKDDRFNQAVDKKTGYRTRSILCIQIRNKTNEAIGVVQVLNKMKDSFNEIDEKRLRAFSAKAAIAIENSKLFDAVQRMKNYNEAMLESLRSGIITTDEKGVIVKTNSCALNMLSMDQSFIGKRVENFFVGENVWIAQRVRRILQVGGSDETLDASFSIEKGDSQQIVSINLNIQPLIDTDNKAEAIGCLLVFEDISQEKRLRSTMARFLPKEVSDRLLEQREQSLGGTLQTATILFSDIRKFTEFSERNGPQKTVQMLNDYFTVMYEQITKHNGILDKYIGDAIMAVFGVPFGSPVDADNAVQTSISMVIALKDFNATRSELELEPIEIGVGINTGEVVSGNIGSNKRMDYTVIGDGVNLAARLEGATKIYKTPILLSKGTRNSLTKEFAMRELDWLRVKGKDEPVAIFEVLDVMEPMKKKLMKENITTFEEGLDLYRNQKWSEAISKFNQLLDIVHDDVSILFIERCNFFLDNPPSEGWDGVCTLVTK